MVRIRGLRSLQTSTNNSRLASEWRRRPTSPALAENTDLEINGVIIHTVAAVQVSTVEDPSASCARADVNIGGMVAVTLRGPKR